MVVTCFDELVGTKDLVFLRGDVIASLDEDEGKTLLKRMLETYLVEYQYENARQFNHESDRFDYQKYIQEELSRFTHLNKYFKENKKAKLDMTRFDYADRYLTDAELGLKKGDIR